MNLSLDEDIKKDESVIVERLKPLIKSKMESKNILSSRSRFGNVDGNVLTSTPMMKSEIGRRLIRRQFVANIPSDISSLEGINIEDMSPVEPFIFTKEPEADSPKFEFHTPKSISLETLDKYQKMFSETPKLKRMRIRL